MATNNSEPQGTQKHRLTIKGWFVILAMSTVGAVYIYHLYNEEQVFFINSYYFRTLQEVATDINNRVEQLTRLHKYGESKSTIISIFPSYVPYVRKNEDDNCPDMNKQKNKNNCASNKKYTYTLGNRRIEIKNGQYTHQVDMVDVIPVPGNDFLLYLITDENNRVLSSTTAASGFSIIDTRLISREIQARQNQDWKNLAANKSGDEPDDTKSLPGYSTLIDVELTTGKFRLFILPFNLHQDITIRPDKEINYHHPSQVNNGDKGQKAEAEPLYLIGVQPESVIDAYENKRWYLSLLLLSLVALVFSWAVTRLFMLSLHQTIGNIFYRTTVLTSYLMFIMLAALLLAEGQRQSALANKQENALILSDQIRDGVLRDLYSIFQALIDYRQYYIDLLKHVPRPFDDENSKTLTDCKDYAPLNENIIQKIISVAEAKIPLKKILLKTCHLSKENNKKPYLTTITAGKRGNDGFKWDKLDAYNNIPDDSEMCIKKNKYLSLFSCINLYGPSSDVSIKPAQEKDRNIEVIERFDINDVKSLPAQGKLLGVFLMDGYGQQVLPQFFYTESNKAPESYDLAQRDYFRRVRDQAGWNASFRDPPQEGADRKQTKEANDEQSVDTCCRASGVLQTCITNTGRILKVNNFYIQRLLNINTGTRGTTLGLSLQPADSCANNNNTVNTENGYILGADIVLPSLSLTPWPEPMLLQDMVIMVVDRVSGEVLYHMDDKRSLVENLYDSGPSAADISQAIRAGRLNHRPVAGHYRGQPGKFLPSKLPINQWALVIFIPDTNTESLMTNVFLASAAGMGAILLILAWLLYLLRRFYASDALKAHWHIPRAVNRHHVMLFSSIFIASIYLGYRLGTVISQHSEMGLRCATIFGSLLAMTIALIWGYAVLQRLQKQNRPKTFQAGGIGPGTVLLLTLFLAIGGVVVIYLQHVGAMPTQGMYWYYENNLHSARLNQEFIELREIALARYPNTIRQSLKEPLSLLPISYGDDWSKKLKNVYSVTQQNEEDNDRKNQLKRYTLPASVGTFSQLTNNTDPFRWVSRYLLNIPGNKDDQNDEDKDHNHDCGTLLRFLAVMCAAFLLLCWFWYSFYRWVIWARFVGSPGLIEHLRNITRSKVPKNAYAPDSRLILDLEDKRHAGYNLSALLNQYGDSPHTRLEMEVATRQGISVLLEKCPELKAEPKQADPFPEVKISFSPVATEPTPRTYAPSGLEGTEVILSNLDICLSQVKLRESLLRLIRQLKVLILAEHESKLRIGLDFHDYEALLLKAHNMDTKREPMTDLEFASWAETWMDFSIKLPQSLTKKIDPCFVEYECSANKLLKGLPEAVNATEASIPPRKFKGKRVSKIDWDKQRRWLLLRDVNKTDRDWASINWILLKAGALYRHKWETCSSAEKLALYHLANHQRVNTLNAQLLEQLALQGLIRVDRGRIKIINNSFAYFVRHAENPEALKKLVQAGESGAWKEYHLPVTLFAFLLLGGIAYTSGSSLYVIVASLLGLLGTIGSLTSSAKMIKDNLQ